MGTTSDALRKRIHPVNPYEGFDYKSFPRDLRGGLLTQSMQQIFQALRPKLIVEVGTWRGTSACFWANMMRQAGIDGAVLCIDTWLGGLEHIEETNFPDWDVRRYYKHGYPTLYYQFLANVMHEGLHDYIVPLPAASIIASRWLARQKIEADIIYIDASHDEDDVYEDARCYWKSLRKGGVMCGDDFRVEWYPVICGVSRFARSVGLEIKVAMPTWAIQKPI